MRKSRAATTTPLFANASLMTTSLSRVLTHQAPPWRSTIRGKGPAPRGLKIRARRGLSPWRRYSTSSTSMVNCPLVVMAGSSNVRERVGGLLLDHRALEEGGVDRAPEPHGIGEGEVAEIIGGDELVLHELVGFGQHVHHVGHVEVTDVRSEQRVEPRAEGVHPAIEGPGIDTIVRLAPEIELGREEIAQVFLALDPARGVIVEVRDAARGRDGIGTGPAVALAQGRRHVLAPILAHEVHEERAIQVAGIGVLERLAVALLPVADEIGVEHGGPADAALEEGEVEAGEPPR